MDEAQEETGFKSKEEYFVMVFMHSSLDEKNGESSLNYIFRRVGKIFNDYKSAEDFMKEKVKETKNLNKSFCIQKALGWGE